MTRLAKEYGLSDVGFAKICKKYNIPSPPRGYWAKKVAGHRMPKDPLPMRSSDEIIEISPNLSNQFNSHENPKLLKHLERKQNFPPTVVGKALRNPHLLVARSAELLELCEPNHVGILESTDKNCLDIRVSKNGLRRALRIMAKYDSCSRDSIEQLLRTPTIRRHVAKHQPRIQELLKEFPPAPDDTS